MIGTDEVVVSLLLKKRQPARVLQPLRVRGHAFELADGTRWTAIQCSDFNLFGRYLNGEDVTPQLRQRAEIGFNLLRVWTRYRLADAGIGDCTLEQHPDLYAKVPVFLDLCASFGLYIELACYIGPNNEDDPTHWARLGEAALKARTKPLLELVNENNVHPMPLPFERIPGLLCSHGSNGSQSIPIEPFWDYATFHTNGAFEEQRKIGHNAMEIWAGPTLTNETSRFPDVGMWSGPWQPRAYDSAAGAALLCAGSCFHSVLGKSSTLFDAATEQVARDWVAGARSVDLSQQDQGYQHRPDLETAGLLRVYQRGTAIVEIRA